MERALNHSGRTFFQDFTAINLMGEFMRRPDVHFIAFRFMMMLNASKAVVTTTIRLRFDCDSTALRPFDDLCYDCRPTWVWTAVL